MANISNKNALFGVQKQQLKHLPKDEYLALKELSRLSKNMYNAAVYNIRQYYFKEKILSYEKNYHISKHNENYKLLNCNSTIESISSPFIISSFLL